METVLPRRPMQSVSPSGAVAAFPLEIQKLPADVTYYQFLYDHYPIGDGESMEMELSEPGGESSSSGASAIFNVQRRSDAERFCGAVLQHPHGAVQLDALAALWAVRCTLRAEERGQVARVDRLNVPLHVRLPGLALARRRPVVPAAAVASAPRRIGSCTLVATCLVGRVLVIAVQEDCVLLRVKVEEAARWAAVICSRGDGGRLPARVTVTHRAPRGSLPKFDGAPQDLWHTGRDHVTCTEAVKGCDTKSVEGCHAVAVRPVWSQKDALRTLARVQSDVPALPRQHGRSIDLGVKFGEVRDKSK